MNAPNRRTFLKAAGTALTAMAAPAAAPAAPAGGRSWRRGYMLGVSKGPILPHFRDVKAAGFEGVELLSPNQLDPAEVLRARDETGLVIHGVSGSRHWRDPLSSPDPAVVARGLEAIRQEIRDCASYGGTTVLVVPAVVTPQVSYQEAWDRSQAAIRTLLPAAEEAGVKLAIEEVWNHFLLSPLEFARYLDAFESPAVGAYFDVGNVVEFGYPQQWIRALGKRILKVHVKEYAKARRFDCALGEGEIDWPAVGQALEDIGYDGWITAEVPWTGVEAMTDVVARMNRLLRIG